MTLWRSGSNWKWEMCLTLSMERTRIPGNACFALLRRRRVTGSSEFNPFREYGMEQLNTYTPLLVMQPEECIPDGLRDGSGLAMQLHASAGGWSKMALMALINGSRPFMLFIEKQNPPIAKEELNLMILCF